MKEECSISNVLVDDCRKLMHKRVTGINALGSLTEYYMKQWHAKGFLSLGTVAREITDMCELSTIITD